ncbi:hypothetical protein TVAG_147530 [Trichomonas vaginalis G3]|uniref:RRM domain-containing protein n=1 Tax=Trichomonas vaginalis (strain ATCC PRA-98 / G3) TaxID=412133 RepID=A2FTL8_TRIV3|nr:translation initiation factor protein [Trichomonas vaginalis G3]EAX91752.1 hypothetical protein TVAG_147530 [Trichomonas vaginalis G3]KAI5550799.1 translation initiation factor protein [Trichomonas vaginalis G3]|eukprot:XP_001304682.1 hypothetical protein [Trichomonas vaginalis G3]
MDPQQPGQGSTKISVFGLSYKTNVNDIYKAFSKFGTLVECKLILNENNESRGFAFLSYKTQKEAQYAIDCTNGKRFDGGMLKIQWSRPKDQVQPSTSNSSTTHSNTKERKVNFQSFQKQIEQELTTTYKPHRYEKNMNSKV